MNAKNETILDLEAMLDGNLDNVTAAPDFMTPPPGNYTLLIEDAKLEKYKNKDQVEGARIKLTYKVATTHELAPNVQELPVPDGTMFNETFMYTEQGLEFFKKAAQNILNVKSVDGISIRELLSALKGHEFNARIGSRTSTSKKDGKEYENATIRPVHETPAQ